MFETPVPVSPSHESTRERLLDAAGEMFAERGFADATVREICAKAGANLAAVNYHFGSKEQLYAQVLQYADELSMRRHPEFPPPAAGEEPPPEHVLRLFVSQFLKRVFDTGRPLWHDRLIAREMVDPTPALGQLAEKNIKPRALMLQAVVRQLLGERASELDVQLCCASIVGQCLLYHRCQTVVEHVMPAIRLEQPETPDLLAEHIAGFSLMAIAEMRRRIDSRGDNA